MFLNKRIQKVEKFAKFLDKLGWHEKAKQLRTDPIILVPESFNATKAWIEYINRLFGVLSGVFALLFVISAFANRKSAKHVFTFALLGLVFLVLNAWLGSIVVATNLLPGIVSIHFLLSFLCMFFFLLAIHKSKNFEIKSNALHFGPIYKFLFVLSILEVFLGSVSREIVDQLRMQGDLIVDNQLNYKGMGLLFAVHRFLPAAIMAFALSIWWKHRKAELFQSKWMLFVALLILIQIAMGAFNIVLKLPAWSQSIHILIGSGLPVIFFYLSLAKPKQVSL